MKTPLNVGFLSTLVRNLPLLRQILTFKNESGPIFLCEMSGQIQVIQMVQKYHQHTSQFFLWCERKMLANIGSREEFVAAAST